MLRSWPTTNTIKNRMKSARYSMDFANGVKFDMAVVTKRYDHRRDHGDPD